MTSNHDGTTFTRDANGAVRTSTAVGGTAVRHLRNAAGWPVAREESGQLRVTHWNPLDPGGYPIQEKLPGGNTHLPSDNRPGSLVARDYYETTIASARTMLRRWRGSPVRVWSLSSSHPTLTVVLGESPHDGKNLVVMCIGPRWVAGPLSWFNGDLEVSVAGEGQERGFVVSDRTALFEVRCETLEVKEHVNLKST